MFPHGFKLQFTDKELDVYKIDYFGERRNQIKCTCDFLTQHDKHSKMLKLYQKLQRPTNNFILSKKKIVLCHHKSIVESDSISLLWCKNNVFPDQAEYSYFSADFWLKIFSYKAYDIFVLKYFGVSIYL